jgi:hypothetical protein
VRGGHELVQAAERVLDVAHDRQLHALVLVVLGGVDVDVDDGRRGRELACRR